MVRSNHQFNKLVAVLPNNLHLLIYENINLINICWARDWVTKKLLSTTIRVCKKNFSMADLLMKHMY